MVIRRDDCPLENVKEDDKDDVEEDVEKEEEEWHVLDDSCHSHWPFNSDGAGQMIELMIWGCEVEVVWSFWIESPSTGWLWAAASATVANAAALLFNIVPILFATLNCRWEKMHK